MLQIQTKHLQPDIVVLEITGRITIGRECKELEWATESLVSEQRKKIIFDLAGVTHIRQHGNRDHRDVCRASEESGRRVASGRCCRACGTSIEDDERGSDCRATPHDRSSGGILLT